MKILLIHPPRCPEALAPDNMEPLALEVLAATIPEHEVRILDLRCEAPEALSRDLLSFRPCLVGLTVNNSIHVRSSLEVLRNIRSILPGARIVVGGHHPTLVPRDFQVPQVDAIFIGWADRSFPAYVRALAEQDEVTSIPGVQRIEDGRPLEKEAAWYPLGAHEIPFPRRELILRYRNRYRDELGRRCFLVNTARGCTSRCVFCACWKAAGGRVLVRPAESVARELSALPRGARVFFADDHTFADTDRALELGRLILNEGAGRRYSGYSRTDTVVSHPELFERWRQAGLDEITIGVEAANDARLSRMRKGTCSAVNEEAIRVLHRLGITPCAHLLVDPDFAEEDFDELFDFVLRTNLSRPIFVVLTPLPGTALYEAKRSQINQPYERCDFVHSIVPTRLAPERFAERFLRLYYDSYALPRNLRQRLERLGILPPASGARRDLPRPVPLITLAGWHIMARPMAAKLRSYYASIGRQQESGAHHLEIRASCRTA
jgi:radical SAM superfamily enzyme YgiQ (UPF0313 family)